MQLVPKGIIGTKAIGSTVFLCLKLGRLLERAIFRSRLISEQETKNNSGLGAVKAGKAGSAAH